MRLADSGLAGYMAAARSFPYLSAEDEDALARRARAGDEKAAHRLAESHLRLVIRMAYRFSRNGTSAADLVEEGNVGLMMAIERFEPERGFRLSTYAQWWIRAMMTDYLVRSHSLVRIGTNASQKRLFFNLAREKARLGALGAGDLSAADAEAIAATLDVPVAEVVAMNRRMSGDASLNVRADAGDGEGSERLELLPDLGPDQGEAIAEADEEVWRRTLVRNAMGVLNDRERRIFEARRLADVPRTLEDLADEFSVSRERIRQIECKAFEKVNAAVRRAAAPPEPVAA